MIAQTLSFLALVAAVAAATTESASDSTTTAFPQRPMEGVDPNSVACDPAGQIFLLLPHFTDCGRFYTCDNGLEVEFSCPPPLIFDFELQTCNWERETKCVLRSLDEIEGSGSEEASGLSEGDIGLFGEEIENGPINILTAESTGTVRPLSPIVARLFNGILNCNKADAAARQIPYKGDCQRYWKCAGGIPKAVYCSDGLFFNESTMQCDYEANAHCNVQVEDELKGEFMLSQ